MYIRCCIIIFPSSPPPLSLCFLYTPLSSLVQIIYFTATFPYVVLICFFFRAVTLEGAGEGLRFLFLPSGGREWVSQYNN